MKKQNMSMEQEAKILLQGLVDVGVPYLTLQNVAHNCSLDILGPDQQRIFREGENGSVEPSV